jgi:hypothetical protein
MTRSLFLSAVLVTVAVAGCGDGAGDPPAEPQISAFQAFPNIPLPPDGRSLGSEGTGDALQLLMSTPMSHDSVADYYRTTLAAAPYRLLNETSEGKVVSFYVESGDQRPLWVRVEGLEGGGTMVRLIGAAPPKSAPAAGDSAPPAPAAGDSAQPGPAGSS